MFYKILTYELFKTEKGNKYKIHNTHSGEELIKNKPIAEFLVDRFGGAIKLLPNQINDFKLYHKIMPKGSKYPKHADCLWNNEIWEFKTNKTGKIKTVRGEIRDSHKQANNILIRFDFEISNKVLYRSIKGEIIATKSIEKVWIWKNGRIIKFNRMYITKNKPFKC